LRNVFQIGSFAVCTPIFLPYKSCGELMGDEASDIIAKGLFYVLASRKIVTFAKHSCLGSA